MYTSCLLQALIQTQSGYIITIEAGLGLFTITGEPTLVGKSHVFPS